MDGALVACSSLAERLAGVVPAGYGISLQRSGLPLPLPTISLVGEALVSTGLRSQVANAHDWFVKRL